MDMGLRGKVALVAAASKGLGKATAFALAREGANVAICSRNTAALAATAGEIRQATGVDVLAVPADVTKAEDIDNFVTQAATHFGRIDILVTNAGGPPSGRFETFSDADWQAAFNLTFMSVVRMIRATLPHLRRAGGGRIVCIASGSVKQPIQGLLMSNSLRPGIVGLAKTLSLELAKENILVNCVLPGTHDTDRIRELDAARAQRESRPVAEVARERIGAIPVGRIGKPEELASLVVYYCSEQASFMTGTSIQVDGGENRALF